MLLLVDSILYSYAQIFFSNRRWFGLIALLATMIIPQIGFMGLLGVVLSNLFAYILKFDTEKIRSGFYGFNGILFGSAITYYFELNLTIILILPVFIFLTFFIAASLEHYLAEAFNLPGLSLPFVISVFILIVFLSNYNGISRVHIEEVSIPFFNNLPESVKYYFKSISLILFQPSILSGIVLSIGLLFFSRILFVISIISFILSIVFLNLILPQHSYYTILYTFNAILVGFALGGSLIIPSKKSFFLVIISSLLVVITTGFFIKLLSDTQLPVLVLPFNFITLAAIYSLKFRKDNTDLTLLYFAPGSPEENYYYHQKRKSRFAGFKYLYPELPIFGEWFISQGYNGKHTHKEEFKYAWDFVVVDEKKEQFSGTGNNLSDYYCYNLPVMAPLEGDVVKVVDGIPDNEIGAVNIEKNWGNTVIIKNEYGLFTSISHLESDTIKVKEGDKVSKGAIIGNCGSSGRSPFPHIHMQFQATDKLGDKTHKFPFSYYIVKKEEKLFLKTFDYPKEGEVVSNVETHKTIKKAFSLKMGERLKFSYNLKDAEVVEEWEVKINILNEYYLDSDKGATASFFLTDKIFYFDAFNGNRNTALYYFYLAAMQAPLCYHQNLFWEDTYSIDQLPGSRIRYFYEFLLFFKNFLNAKGNFKYEEHSDEETNFIINNNIKIKGAGILSFFTKDINTKVFINGEGEIERFLVSQNKKDIFNARLVKEVEVS